MRDSTNFFIVIQLDERKISGLTTCRLEGNSGATSDYVDENGSKWPGLPQTHGLKQSTWIKTDHSGGWWWLMLLQTHGDVCRRPWWLPCPSE